MAAILRRKLPSLPSLLPRIRPFSALPEPESEFHQTPDGTDPTPPSDTKHPLLRLQLAIRSESDPERVADLFLSSRHVHQFHSSRPLFSLTVRKLSHARRPDLIRRILDPFLTDPNSPKVEGFLARILTLYSSAGLLDAAKEAFLRPSPFTKSDLSLSALLSGYLHNGRYDELKSTFEEAASKFNISPGTVSHNILLNGMCENGEIEAARKLLDEMSKGENNLPEPSIISYNTVLCGYLKQGKEEQFDQILKEIEDRDLEMNVVTFNCRISRFCKKGESFKAEELFDVMCSRGIQPSVSTFYHLIQGYCKENNLNSAIGMFKKMKAAKRRSGSDGVSPNADIYNMLIKNLIEKAQFDDALWICVESMGRKSLLPFEDVKCIVEGLVKESKVEKAKYLVEKMRKVLKGEARDAWEKIIGDVFEATASSQ
ncbi:Pentatricopeptide repeat-containing protein [Rhynchospora pubera]|uniref:Pentatricopeptide repeat-containing protein n=1 Tax=Rhynchospora pubera TaxID=906938 RepID=A0AAV8GGJ3_9POAL|nr:Pentatricopeptide repeat-containing protein [Rhynchospora pubera]